MPLRASRNQGRNRWQWALCGLLAIAALASARSDDGPTVKVSATSSASISLDGLLNEPAWQRCARTETRAAGAEAGSADTL